MMYNLPYSIVLGKNADRRGHHPEKPSDAGHFRHNLSRRERPEYESEPGGQISPVLFIYHTRIHRSDAQDQLSSWLQYAMDFLTHRARLGKILEDTRRDYQVKSVGLEG